MTLVPVRDNRQQMDQQLRAELQSQVADFQAARVETAKLKTIKNQHERQLAELRQQLKEAHTEIGTNYKSLWKFDYRDLDCLILGSKEFVWAITLLVNGDIEEYFTYIY